MQVDTTLLWFLLLPIYHNIPSGKYFSEASGPLCVVYIVPITDVNGKQMAFCHHAVAPHCCSY